MSADEHLNDDQFHYHFSSPENRESIRQHGLQPGRRPHVFVTSDPVHYSGFASEDADLDMWRVHTKGLHLEEDPHFGDARHGAMIHHGPIAPHRLKHMGSAFQYGLEHGAFEDW